MIEAASILASSILLALIVFQLLLVLGLPIGRFAWGGEHTILPTKLRVASIVSIILYIFFAAILLNQSGIIKLVDRNGWPEVALAILTGYFFLGILMNAISRSKPERLVMTPVAATLAILFLYVALNTK